MAKLDRRSAGGQDLICWQHQALEASIAWIVSDANVNLATLQHGSLVSTKGLGQFHVHVGKALSVLCGVPYEVARSGGHFKAHRLDVQLVYTRGGNAAMQALVGGAVDYAATALDVAVQAYANVGADIRRFAVTGRLPLFAVVTAPNTASQIQSIKDLEGRTVGISALGNADHALTLYLLKQAAGDAQKVKFATMGVNLLEALRQGQIDVGVVQGLIINHKRTNECALA